MSTDFAPSHLNSASGAKLAIRYLPATGKAKGIIHIHHGLAEHSARYERFATALSKAGYHALAHDHRGHGATTADDAPLGTFARNDGLQVVLSDMLAVNQHIKSQTPDLPLIYFGHSMGGILGLNYCIQHSDTIDGAALWNFNVDGGFLVSALGFMLKIERALKGSDVPSQLANKLTFDDWNKKFKPNRTDFDWLSRDEAEVDAYIADPLCGFPASNGLWLQLISAIKKGSSDQELAKIRNDLPFNLVGGEADPTSDNGKSMSRLAKRLVSSGVEDVSLTLLANTRHETLNEINRDEATADFIQWLDTRFA